jgi:type IV pilus assembly protein PilY1
MYRKLLVSISSCILALALVPNARAQSLLKEDFTTTTTTNSWFFYNGACLTASTASPGANPGIIPGCTADSYYKENLTGGIHGNSGSSQTLPDPSGQGALRFTNGSPGGFNQNGAIISALPYSTANGLNITFATISYRGNSGTISSSGNNNTLGDPGFGLPIGAADGADGMSFFLLNGQKPDGTPATPTGAGSFGGSLGYSCSNSNPGYTGIPSGYLGLGIDEYGNFLNSSDNTKSGPGPQANRIGLRGAGDVNFNALTALNSSYYPSTLATLGMIDPATGNYFWKDGTTPFTVADNAVGDTCRTGYLWDYSKAKVDTNGNLSGQKQTTTTVQDYQSITNGYTVLSGVKIADEFSSGGYARNSTGVAPIYYRLKITPTGLLSLQYSYNGGAYIYVLQNQSLTSVSGNVPASLYFGFAGSTGGATNIHEILCFQAAPNSVSSSSSATNQRQAAQLNSTSQAFFAFYNPNDWTGRVTANALVASGDTLNISATPTWDASCVLTGATAAQCATGQATTVEGPTSRQILTWNGSTGVPFQFNNLSLAQQVTLDALDPTLNLGAVANALCFPHCRLDYLRGDRTFEVNPFGLGLFRDRTDVLADVVDSSPVWVGPPNAVMPKTWLDRAHPTSALPTPYPENGGPSYATYTIAQQGRTNVVYVGSNDGMLHGFRAGSVDITGKLTGAVPNDGYEIMSYVPGSVINSQPTAAASNALLAYNCTNLNATPTQVQNIHGAVPQDGLAFPCVQAALDYANTQYGHNYFVDSTPASGDIFYNNAWHTWLVGGLGYGGSAIYALDVTNPTSLTESNAGAVVMGEWTPATLTCANVANCGNSLGQLTGSPVIRRLHNGRWGIIFGNGINSTSGDAGIYVMVLPQTGVTAPVAATVYYLSAGITTKNDGISAVAAADLDGDSIIDYVYAGDLLGNVWRFDLTSITASSWAISSTTPLFNTGGLPITTHVMVAGGAVTGQTVPQVMIGFGTGEKMPITNTTAASYQTSSQKLFGFWDWNMTAWNTLNPSAPYLALTPAVESGCVPGITLTSARTTTQTVTANADGSRSISSPASIVWPTTTSCTGSSSFGWNIVLPGSQEQIIFNPLLFNGAFIVNSIIPAGSNLLSCNIVTDTGVTYAISILNGAALPSFFQNYSNDTTAGVQYNGSGAGSIVTNSAAADTNTTDTWLVMQTFPGQPTAPKINPPNNIVGSRVTWKQLR